MSDKKYLEAESLKEAMWKRFYAEEDKWERTPEADFLNVHGGCPRHWFQLGFSAGLDAVVKADPVPHEMTARELFSARDRMCNSNYNRGHIRPACKTCPLWRENNGYDMYCGTLMTMRPLDFLAIVEKWAQEHPEERR